MAIHCYLIYIKIQIVMVLPWPERKIDIYVEKINCRKVNLYLNRY